MTMSWRYHWPFQFLRPCLLLLFTISLPAPPVLAQSGIGAGYLSGELLVAAEDDPDAALAEIARLIEELSGAADADPRILFDLYRQEADILQATGRTEDAGAALILLANYAAKHRDVLPASPEALLSEAAALLRSAGAYDAARYALTELVEEQRDGGLPGPSIAATLRELAALERLRGDDDAARAAEARAAEAEAAQTAGSTRGSGSGHSLVDVYFATDRAETGSDLPARHFGFGRSPDLSYGVVTVTIPDSHSPGLIEKPKIWQAEFGLSPSRHVMLKSLTTLSKNDFFASLDDSVAARDRKEVFLFIHGYNVTFENAAKRAAQMAYDMNFSGLPVLYSWPSRGSAMGYIRDSAVVRWSGRKLSAFIEDLVAREGIERLHIVGHSMGNRALTDALELMALRRGTTAGDMPVLDQVVFAAPDVDADLFASMMPTIRPLARRLTLYASEEDWALFASRKLHGDAPRAGQAGEDVLVAAEFDSIDMSRLGADMLSHSYFSSALLDLYTLFWRDLDPARRCGIRAAAQSGERIWRYEPEACQDDLLLNLLFTISQDASLTPDKVEAMLLQVVGDPQVASDLANTLIKILPE
jgi:esterase/lipase superfamily enzyme